MPAITSTSITRGLTGGVVAALIGIPLLPIVFVVCDFGELTLMARVMHVHTTYGSMTDRQHMVGTLVVAAATGFLTAAIAALGALKLIGIGRRWPFVAVGGLGYTAIAFTAWAIVGHGHPERSPGLAIFLLWLLAVAGLAGMHAVLADEAAKPIRR